MIRLRVSLASRRGIAEPLSTLVAFPVLLILIAFILYFGRALYVKAAVEDAAAVGARWAATSLSGAQGCRQAREAMHIVFNGYYVNPGGFTYSVRPTLVWGRGRTARVTVGYRLSQAAVPIFGPLLGDAQLSASYHVPIDAFNNRYAWSAC